MNDCNSPQLRLFAKLFTRILTGKSEALLFYIWELLSNHFNVTVSHVSMETGIGMVQILVYLLPDLSSSVMSLNYVHMKYCLT